MFHYRDYIYCVYKEKSFTKAAEKLHISQPSLSALVRKAEQNLGQPIFNRKTTPLTLTPFGTEYVKGIEYVYELEQHLKNVSADLSMLQTGHLSVGASNLSIPHFLPKALAAYKKYYPNVHLEIIETSTIHAKQMLDTGTLDIMVTNKPLGSDRYEAMPCYKERLVVAVPKEFEINEKLVDLRLDDTRFLPPIDQGVSLSEFKDIPFILLSSENYLRTCTDILFKEAQTVPNIVMEVDQSSVSYNLADYGMGATIFSNRFVQSSDARKNLYYYPIASPYAEREGFVCYRRGSYMTMAMRRFLEILQQTLESE